MTVENTIETRRATVAIETHADGKRWRVVATSKRTGHVFRASFRVCGCERPPCVCVTGKTPDQRSRLLEWPSKRAHSREHCHATTGWHAEHVHAFAQHIAKTYKKA